jgi:putative GTP pyrophosphokinase
VGKKMIVKHLKEHFFKELTSEENMERIKEGTLPYNRLMSYYRCAIMEIETKFKVLNEQFSLSYDENPIETIKTRLKSPDSIMKKMQKRNLPMTTEAIEENITDIAGVRIICSFEKDIYKMADLLLQQDDIKLIRKKDYIAKPKDSGYRSLHLIVEVPIFLENEKRSMKVEVQLRTIAMDFWASLEHKMRYKKDIPPEKMEQLSRDLTECAEKCADLDHRMEKIKKQLEKSKKYEVI